MNAMATEDCYWYLSSADELWHHNFRTAGVIIERLLPFRVELNRRRVEAEKNRREEE